MIALIRRRFLRLLAGFGGAVAVGAAFGPQKAHAQTPKNQEGKPDDKGSDKGQERSAKEKKAKRGDEKAKEKARKKKKDRKPKKPTNPKASEKAEKQHKRVQEQKAKEAEAKKQRKGGSLFEDERLKNERLARTIVERHAKG